MLRRQALTQEYLPPSTSDFETSLGKLRALIKNKSEERKHLYNMMWNVEWLAKEEGLAEEKKHQLKLAMAFAWLEQSPKDKTKEYNKTYFAQAKPTFPREVSRALGLNENNVCGPRTRLAYLTELYEFLGEQKSLSVQTALVENLRDFVLIAMSAVLNRVLANTTIEPNAIPKEVELDSTLSRFSDDYLAAKEKSNETVNPDRLFLAQIASVLPKMLRIDKEDRTKEEVERSWRIKVGSPLQILWSINSRGSDLYLMALEALNITRTRNIDMAVQIECLAAFNSFISDTQNRSELERLGEELFGEANLLKSDAKLDLLKDEINAMIEGTHQNMTLFRTFLSTAGDVTGLTVGATTGLLASQTAWGAVVKEAFCKVVLGLGALTGNSSLMIGGGVLLSFAANQLAIVGMIVTLAKALSVVGKTVGTGIGMGLDSAAGVSYKQLQKLCDALIDTCQKDGHISKYVDVELVALLKRQPEAVFSANNKQAQKVLDLEQEVNEFELVPSSPTLTR